MKMRKFAALLLGMVLMMMQVVTAQATLDYEGPSQVDKFAAGETETYSTLPLPETPAVIPEDEGPVQIDKFTGEELTGGGDVGGGRVYVNATATYDRDMRAFVYETAKEEVFSNVASGMVTTQPVWLLFSESLSYHLYRNGELVRDVDYSEITEPGAYTFTGDELNDRTEILHFTIANPVTGRLSRFQVPDGFVITSALVDNVRVSTARTYVDMDHEGTYDISYRCPVTEEMYMFRVIVDHTPPTLALAELQEDGTAKGPVDISDVEEGAEIGVWLNNKQIPYQKVLTESGRYRIVLTDAAGNMSNYEFMIRVYYNTNSIVFFVAILALGAGVGIYALYSRRHMRIR